MRHVLIFLESNDAERESPVHRASDLVEFVTAPSEDNHVVVARMGIVAQVEDCLEIGIAMLGRGSPRTVEGGDRRASPVSIFPFSAAADEKDEAPLQALGDLIDMGAIEAHAFDVGQMGVPGPEAALRRALNSEKWDDILILGSAESANKLEGGKDLPRIVRPVPFSEFRDRAEDVALSLRIDLEKDDPFSNARIASVQAALQFEDLLGKLHLLD